MNLGGALAPAQDLDQAAYEALHDGFDAPGAGPAPPRHFEIERIRITSYNVCYTKLLRSAQRGAKRQPAGQDPGAGTCPGIAASRSREPALGASRRGSEAKSPRV